ncbi:MAG: hypothetical protein AB7V19_04240, partial [Candidatus Bipolaricaulia bacterium]
RAEIFSLLCPTREYDWIPTWDCELVFTDTGYAESSCIFTTRSDEDGLATWVCTRYEPNDEVEYVRFSADLVLRLRIRVCQGSDGRIINTWQSQLTALTDRGDAYIDSLAHKPPQEAPHAGALRLIEHYVTTGEMPTSGRHAAGPAHG